MFFCGGCCKNTQNTRFEEWWAFTSMYPQVKFRNSCFRERHGFITLSVIPLLVSHAWGQSLEILLKDTLEIYIRTVAPCFNASIVYYTDDIQNIFAFMGDNGMLKSTYKTFKTPPLLFSWLPSFSVSWLKVGPKKRGKASEKSPLQGKGRGEWYLYPSICPLNQSDPLSATNTLPLPSQAQPNQWTIEWMKDSNNSSCWPDKNKHLLSH